MTLREAALMYAEKYSFSVIPLISGQKRPLIKWEPYQTKKASLIEIQDWWVKWPDANIGIVTGQISGICLVDADRYKQNYSEEIFLQYFNDSIVTPCVITPRGGLHMVFKAPREVISGKAEAANLPAIDFRCDGNYMVAPPSTNEKRIAYKWIEGCSIFEIEPTGLPDAFLKALYKYNSLYIYSNVTSKKWDDKNPLQSVTLSFEEGKRDESLFHVAHTMSKGGASPGDVSLVLNLLANQCNPPFPKSEVEIKIKSVLERTARKERNLMKELTCYIDVTSGWFSVTSCYTELHVVTKEDKTAIRVGLKRLKDGGIIEKVGEKDGVYKKIVHNVEFINFIEDEKDEEPFPVILPFGLNDLVEISKGNIILVAGEFNAGKTLFMLNVLKENKGKIPVRYMSSEMRKSEFKKRFRGFIDVSPEFWLQDDMTDYVMRSQDFHTALRPNAINIIDYIEFKGADFTQGAELMRQIYDNLGDGIALIAIQKKQGAALPRSGDLVMEKPRLVISLSKIPGADNLGTAEILKAKIVRLGKCDGKKLNFEIINWGSTFRILRDWGYWR